MSLDVNINGLICVYLQSIFCSNYKRLVFTPGFLISAAVYGFFFCKKSN